MPSVILQDVVRLNVVAPYTSVEERRYLFLKVDLTTFSSCQLMLSSTPPISLRRLEEGTPVPGLQGLK
jgi:hypothetical protein